MIGLELVGPLALDPSGEAAVSSRSWDFDLLDECCPLTEDLAWREWIFHTVIGCIRWNSFQSTNPMASISSMMFLCAFKKLCLNFGSINKISFHLFTIDFSFSVIFGVLVLNYRLMYTSKWVWERLSCLDFEAYFPKDNPCLITGNNGQITFLQKCRI